jgi:hypothetical protein
MLMPFPFHLFRAIFPPHPSPYPSCGPHPCLDDRLASWYPPPRPRETVGVKARVTSTDVVRSPPQSCREGRGTKPPTQWSQAVFSAAWWCTCGRGPLSPYWGRRGKSSSLLHKRGCMPLSLSPSPSQLGEANGALRSPSPPKVESPKEEPPKKKPPPRVVTSARPLGS